MSEHETTLYPTKEKRETTENILLSDNKKKNGVLYMQWQTAQAVKSNL